MNQEIYSLDSTDISGAANAVDRYIAIRQEYKKMLTYEKLRLDDEIKKRRRRIKKRIKSLN